VSGDMRTQENIDVCDCSCAFRWMLRVCEDAGGGAFEVQRCEVRWREF
jgi:hypothetical protein